MNDRDKQIIDIIAKQTARKWNTVEYEDLSQHLVLFFLESKEAFDRYKQHPLGEGSIRVALTREALKYAENETKHVNKMLIEDGYTYSTDNIENALPFLYEDIMQSLTTSVMENPITHGSIKDGHDTDYGKALVIMLDLKIGYDKLSQEEQETLELRFRDELTLKEMANIFSISSEGVRIKVNRIIKKLQRLMG
jgi:DNA-directed RNA polymerase specialized sigma24 family protein